MSDKEKSGRIPLTAEKVTPNVFIADSKQAEEYKALFAAALIDPNKPEPEPETLLSLFDTPILWRGGKAFVCGVAKSRKTTALTILSAILMGRNESGKGFIAKDGLRVLYCDTEQSRADSQRILRRVAKLTDRAAGDMTFNVLSLNQLSPDQIKGVIEIALQIRGYDVVILDNWTDCVKSVMEEEYCATFSRQLRELAENYKVAILSVIHANESARNDDRPNFRGWASEEARKCDLTMFLKDMGDYSKVTFGRCRGKRPEDFYVSIDAEGWPYLYTPTPAEEANADKYAAVVSQIPPTGLTNAELCKVVMATQGIVQRTAQRWVKEMRLKAVKFIDGRYYNPATAPKKEVEQLTF